MKYPKIRELKEAITALMKGPYTSKFPYKPYTPPKKFRGKPVPNDQWCVGCGACAELCPSAAIEIIDDQENAVRRIIRHYDKCIFCGQCELNCTTEKGIHLTDEYDLAVFDRASLFHEQKKELVLCEKCGCIIGTKQQLLWLASKLGPLAYGNLLLILTAQKELEIAKEEKIPSIKPATPDRSDIFRILCPKCRRVILLFDQYALPR
jgi:formate hydrogenlyase subunit 6/NADH:ubiquinone oxidoreductase subunit I